MLRHLNVFTIQKDDMDIGYWPDLSIYPPTAMERRFLPENCIEMDAVVTADRKAIKAALDTCTDPAWKVFRPEEYQVVIAYLGSPDRQVGYHGDSWCRVCNCRNGSHDYYRESFKYPEGYIHYITEHGIVPPRELIEAALEAAKGTDP